LKTNGVNESQELMMRIWHLVVFGAD